MLSTLRQPASLQVPGHNHHMRSQYKLQILPTLFPTKMMAQYGVNPWEAGILAMQMISPKPRLDGTLSLDGTASLTPEAGGRKRKHHRIPGIRMKPGD